jgi:lipopolysaccharide biosynthesis glycosyltransferase
MVPSRSRKTAPAKTAPAKIAPAKSSCLATVVSDPFVYGAVVMLASFRRENPWFEGDIVILHDDTTSPLSPKNRELIARIAPEARFQPVDIRRFERIFRFAEDVVRTPTRLRAAFLILECFTFSQYERVLTLDSDMVVLGSLRFLFELEQEFCVVRAHDTVADLPLPFFNTGTMMIRGSMLDADMLETISHALEGVSVDRDHGKADQAVLNVFFRDRPKTYLDGRYNFSKRLVPAGDLDVLKFLRDKDVRVLHFLGEKPWNLKIKDPERDYRRLEDLWLKYFFSVAPATARFRLTRELLYQERMVRDYLISGQGAGKSKKVLWRELEEQLAKRLYEGPG